jgi:hypothetical protein
MDKDDSINMTKQTPHLIKLGIERGWLDLKIH